MKLRLMAEITDDNGRKVITPVEIEREIPDTEAFIDPTKFYEVFDEYERPALEARTQLMEELTKEYLEQATLKKEESAQDCEVEAEIGRIPVKNGSGIVPARQPKERIWSLSFRELAWMTGTELSYAKGRKVLNRLLRRRGKDSIKSGLGLLRQKRSGIGHIHGRKGRKSVGSVRIS